MKFSVPTKLKAGGILLAVCTLAAPRGVGQLSENDQHSIRWHTSDQIVSTRRPAGPDPVTVATEVESATEYLLPIDEAIRIALQHAEVIRTLGSTNVSPGQTTIYDTAIASTPIDQQIARFDPVFSANTTWRKNETVGISSLGANGNQSGGNSFSAQLSRRNRTGGVASITMDNEWSYDDSRISGVNRSHRPSLEVSYTQPLLSGAGIAANEAPILIARFQQDQSFFQFKDRTQQLVQDVIRGYWDLVSARTAHWARKKQVEQSQFEYERAVGRKNTKLANIGDVSQARVALANFRANLIAARGAVIQAEADLRNLLGLPPEDGRRLVPSTPPTRDRLQFDWRELVDTAQQYRPDLIELHLILMADQQQLIQNRNLAQPELNAIAVQGWNGVTGRAITGRTISSPLDDNPTWSLGLQFSVPLTLRQSRASLRTTELTLARDRANISQGIHATEHSVARVIRDLEQFYEQYEAFRETRDAAFTNLKLQMAERVAGRAIFLDVLQAITSWGDAVASEANSLTSYNSSLAALEQSTGTILATHGISFAEEKYASMGAWGKHFELDCYPRSLNPMPGPARYPNSGEASEESFNLKDLRESTKSRQQERTAPIDSIRPISNTQTVSADFPADTNSRKTSDSQRPAKTSWRTRLRRFFDGR